MVSKLVQSGVSPLFLCQSIHQRVDVVLLFFEIVGLNVYFLEGLNLGLDLLHPFVQIKHQILYFGLLFFGFLDALRLLLGLFVDGIV